MFGYITGKKIRRRSVAFGMAALLFAAGLAFAVFENTAGSRLMPSIGMSEEEETLAAATDPRLDPYDCLFEPEALKELTAEPRSTAESGDTDPSLPADHPGTNVTPRVVAGDDGDTESARSSAGSPESPGSPSGGSDGSPSNGETDGEGDTRPASPHDRNRETDCPGLQ